jgi:hypothetical protein
MVSPGRDLPRVAERLGRHVRRERHGHQSATETLDTYSHLWPDSDDETRAAVDSVLSRVAV